MAEMHKGFIMSSMAEMHKGVPPLLTDSCYASSYYTTAIHIYPHLPPGVIPASFALIVSFVPTQFFGARCSAVMHNLSSILTST